MKLSDDTSLSSLCPGDHLELDIHSFVVTVKSKESDPEQFEFPVTILGEHWNQAEKIIKGYVEAAKEFKLKDLTLYGVYEGHLKRLDDWTVEPGDTFVMKVRPLDLLKKLKKSARHGQGETSQPAAKVMKFT